MEPSHKPPATRPQRSYPPLCLACNASQHRPTVVASPSVQRTVDIMMKKGVQVEAAQPVSASGLSFPVLLLALLPYPILAYFALGLVNSLGSSADFSETEKLLEPPQPPAREKKERYRSDED